MNDVWHVPTDNAIITEEGISIRFTLPRSSPWFSGHFPGFPLLPGIAQVFMAFAAVKDHERHGGRNVALVEMKRVRFKRMIRPDETIDLTVTPDAREGNRYAFMITVDRELASSGSFIIKDTQ